MTDEDRTKAIQFLIHDVFMPEYNRCFKQFIDEYGKRVQDDTKHFMQTGTPINRPPIQLNITEPMAKLTMNIIAIEVLFKKKKDGSNKK